MNFIAKRSSSTGNFVSENTERHELLLCLGLLQDTTSLNAPVQIYTITEGRSFFYLHTYLFRKRDDEKFPLRFHYIIPTMGDTAKGMNKLACKIMFRYMRRFN